MALNKDEKSFCILEYKEHPPLLLYDCLNTNLRQRWVGCFGQDVTLMCWPPRSPDLTPCGDL